MIILPKPSQVYIYLRFNSLVRNSKHVSKRLITSRGSSNTKLKWSYLQGTSDTPLIGKTVGQCLDDAAKECPDKTAVIFPEQNARLTFSQLLNESRKFASGLLGLGLQPGDRVGIWGPNMVEWVITQYGAALAGMILVNINPAYKAQELKYAMNKVGVKALVAARSFKATDYYEILSTVSEELATCQPGNLRSQNVPELRVVVMTGTEPLPGVVCFDGVLNAGDSSHVKRLEEIAHKIQMDHPFNIQYTSGTTGQPKAAILSHHNIVNNGYFTGIRLHYHCEETIICCVPPLFHCFGIVLASLNAMTHKNTVVFPCAGVNPEATLKAIQNERCTSLYGTPTMFIDLLNHPDLNKYDVSSLSRGIMAGSPCPIEVMKQCISKLNMNKATVVYGMTENSPVTFQSCMDDALDKRVSTVGRPGAHTEVKVVDRDGCVVPVGVPGELLTRGYTTMMGYWGQPEKTREVLQEDGWFRTGDIAVIDEDGYGSIVGRITDCVIRGGENIYPAEIEQYLYKHPDVEDVQVVGVPDKRMGEELCAYIKRKNGSNITEEILKQFCKGEIAHYKIPRYILFVTEFPLTITGKIQKFKLREQAVQTLNLTP